jgi:YHS domain-containing protein
MSKQRTFLKTTMIVAAAALAILVLAQGCQKEEPTTETPSVESQAEQMAVTAKETAEAAAEDATETIAQKTCPVMGAPINEAIFVEYEGKKVYFCCKGCETQFEADPAKYVKDLPQFQN